MALGVAVAVLATISGWNPGVIGLGRGVGTRGSVAAGSAAGSGAGVDCSSSEGGGDMSLVGVEAGEGGNDGGGPEAGCESRSIESGGLGLRNVGRYCDDGIAGVSRRTEG